MRDVKPELELIDAKLSCVAQVDSDASAQLMAAATQIERTGCVADSRENQLRRALRYRRQAR